MTVSDRSFRRLWRLPIAAALLTSALSSGVAAQDFEFEDEPAKRSFGLQFGAQRSMGDLLSFTERGLGLSVHGRQPIKGSRIASLRADVGFGRFAQNRSIGDRLPDRRRSTTVSPRRWR